MRISDEQIEYLVGQAIAGRCQGHRPEIFATKIAVASAALRGVERVTAGDLRVGVALAIAPRVTVPLHDQGQPPPPPPPPPPTPPENEQARDEEQGREKEEREEEGDHQDEEEEREKEEQDEEQRQEEDEEENEEEEDLIPEEALVFAPEESSGAPDPELLLRFAQALQRKPGRAGRAKKNVVFSLDQGGALLPRQPESQTTDL